MRTNGDISGYRLSYKWGTGIAAVGSSIAVGFTTGSAAGPLGSLAGTTVGTAAVAAEMTFDLGMWWTGQVATFNTQLETALRGGWFPVKR
jgi:hypothetical protein